MIRAIIFDFDGVITESVGVKADGFAMIYESYGKEVVTKVIDHHYINGGVSRYKKFCYYHKNFLGIALSDVELRKLSLRFSNFVVERIIKSPYVKGALEFLELNYKKYDLFISTGTPQDEINKIIKSKGIDYYFNAIFGSPKNKFNHIEKIMMNNNYSKEEVVFIGDSIQDKIAAGDKQLTFIGRIEGENTQLLYEKYKVNDLTELEGLLEIINN